MSRAGVSLVELLVAVAIVGVGLAGVGSLTAAAARSLVHARALDEAHVLLRNFADSVLAEWGHGSGSTELRSGNLTWSIPRPPAATGWARFEHVALPAPVQIEFTVAASEPPPPGGGG